MTLRPSQWSPRRSLVASVAGALLCCAALAACSHGSKPTAAVGSSTPAGSVSPSASASASAAPPARPRAVYPLTGLAVTDRSKARRPALSVKIDNIGAALPQAGLDRADLVTEALVEGGLTRLMATFQSQDAATIGPIRSARPVDTDLLRQLNGGYFAFSGGNPHELVPIREHSTALLISWDATPAPFWTDPHRVRPHWVFSSTGRLYAWGHRLRPHARPPARLFGYGPLGKRGHPVGRVHLVFSPVSTADWRWSAARQRWLRDQDGSPDVLVNGHRITATNVVVMQVEVRSSGFHDHAGNGVPFDIVVGRGPAWVLRQGRVVPGRWLRPTAAKRMRIVDRAGHVIPLRPGVTWLELLPRPYRPQFD
jgi:Protein of unknown function (DUF3048) N-terminal domain/Protein of unknown function (DUF3048) C-terminal domain